MKNVLREKFENLTGYQYTRERMKLTLTLISRGSVVWTKKNLLHNQCSLGRISRFYPKKIINLFSTERKKNSFDCSHEVAM